MGAVVALLRLRLLRLRLHLRPRQLALAVLVFLLPPRAASVRPTLAPRRFGQQASRSLLLRCRCRCSSEPPGAVCAPCTSFIFENQLVCAPLRLTLDERLSAHRLVPSPSPATLVYRLRALIISLRIREEADVRETATSWAQLHDSTPKGECWATSAESETSNPTPLCCSLKASPTPMKPSSTSER